jgi:hypothetical protein
MLVQRRLKVNSSLRLLLSAICSDTKDTGLMHNYGASRVTPVHNTCWLWNEL